MENQLKQIMCKVFGVTSSEITDQTSIDTLDPWDSLSHMNLIIAIEEEFKIHLPDNKIPDLISYSLLLKAIKGEI